MKSNKDEQKAEYEKIKESGVHRQGGQGYGVSGGIYGYMLMFRNL